MRQSFHFVTALRCHLVASSSLIACYETLLERVFYLDRSYLSVVDRSNHFLLLFLRINGPALSWSSWSDFALEYLWLFTHGCLQFQTWLQGLHWIAQCSSFWIWAFWWVACGLLPRELTFRELESCLRFCSLISRQSQSYVLPNISLHLGPAVSGLKRLIKLSVNELLHGLCLLTAIYVARWPSQPVQVFELVGVWRLIKGWNGTLSSRHWTFQQISHLNHQLVRRCLVDFDIHYLVRPAHCALFWNAPFTWSQRGYLLAAHIRWFRRAQWYLWIRQLQ